MDFNEIDDPITRALTKRIREKFEENVTLFFDIKITLMLIHIFLGFPKLIIIIMMLLVF